MPVPLSLQQRIHDRDENAAMLRKIVTYGPWLYTLVTIGAGIVFVMSVMDDRYEGVALAIALTTVPTMLLSWLARSVVLPLLANLDLCHEPEEPARDVR